MELAAADRRKELTAAWGKVFSRKGTCKELLLQYSRPKTKLSGGDVEVGSSCRSNGG